MSGRLLGRLDMLNLSDKHDSRNLGNGHSSAPSPLKLFGQAKKRINDIFREIGEYIYECDTFVQETLKVAQDLVTDDYAERVKGFKQKVDGIVEVLSRDHMKVVFFGRTSNGKSTVINAMLRDKILPSGIGHTTNCFLQVEGSDSNEAVLLTADSDTPKSINDIKQLAHALSNLKLDSNACIRILWPKDKCRLLKEDVILVDSPGIDVSPDLDNWIDAHCLDADVFVLVANAESTLMQTEKNFFHKVSSKLSKPNIFILQNRWDVSAIEEDIEAVRKQHMERNVQFLGKELNVVRPEDAETRVFFVSAREALMSRLHEDKGTPTPVGALQEGFQVRLFEFANFERTFEECISKSAVKTKFELHTERGKHISSNLRTVMEDVHQRSLQRRSTLDDQTKIVEEKNNELEFMVKQLKIVTGDIKEKIKDMVDNVERKVGSALNEEIHRLSIVVDEFDRPFHPDNLMLNIYKKDLHSHLESTLCRNMVGRCTASVFRGMANMDLYMTEQMATLLKDKEKIQNKLPFPNRDFELMYRLDCRNLCADFHEDIEFRFSFGPTALMQRFFLPLKKQNYLVGGITTPQSQQPERTDVSQSSEVLVAMLSTFASVTSRTTVGAMVLVGMIAKAAGWRVIAVSGALYGLLYCYERLTWTNKAKERAFKRQYVEYASSKLRLIVDLTSSNCSHQVKQELTSTFSIVCHQVDLSKNQLQDEINKIQKDIDQLKDVTSKSKTLRNKADWLDSELKSFTNQYLQHEV
ncbi:mitofusin-2 isoform X1 [Octopus sinensis]|uniref:Mitofusin-2 isoform X1 n=1 Tax=Octopus sinensis TaxID=2607531 RepID=A0A7E6FQ24_9MOLL|nr:mitofusin-2 isoform X1 [Octopus sinensis]